ncbi:hypothetical protein SAMN05443245_5857 [Paraburkholderia fungorum]|uniref:Terminase n=2 Tax=Paraburkholderia fungorum TaxID=134537 RepID=A0A1H1IXU8_9BURK|nr:hypothetical protein SAMN05443245_5857 [Paraburkholderia fungorum]
MQPHAGQLKIYQNRGKSNVLRCGRRFGKTSFFDWLMQCWALNGDKTGIFTPTESTFKESFDKALDTLDPVIHSSNKSDFIIKLRKNRQGKQGVLHFWSLENPRVGRGKEYDHVIIDEASLVPDLERLYQQNIRPLLLRSNGDTWIGGTPLGMTDQDYFWKICTDKTLPQKWTEHYAPCHANPTITAEALKEFEASNHPMVWRQEYLAEFTNWAGVAIFDEEKLLVNGKGVAAPTYCDYVFAVIDSAFKTGSEHDGTGVIFCARNKSIGGPPLTILDWDIVGIDGYLLVDWMPSVFERLNVLARQCGAQVGSAGCWIEDKGSGIVLLQAGREKGWPTHPIEGNITSAGKDGRAVAASRFIHTEQVKITEEAYRLTRDFKNTNKNHLISQVCSYVIGDKGAAKRADDLADCFTYSCLVALGNNDVF